MLPLAFPYPPPPATGYWSPHTSTIDWCEENYVITPFVAEFLNTVSNAFFISLAGYSMVSSLRNKLELRFTLISFGFMLVGIGSWLFHMTLKYEFQLLDELPMIYATCIPMWSIFSEHQSTTTSTTIGLLLLFITQLLTAVYLYFKDPLFHQVCYALLNVMLTAKSIHLTVTHIADYQVKKQMFKIMATGVFLFLFGFILWNLDNFYCSGFISLRRSVGLPYGFLLEFHSWWHCLTGAGVYFYVIYLQYLRICLIGKQNEYRLNYKFGLFPEFVLIHGKKN